MSITDFLCIDRNDLRGFFGLLRYGMFLYRDCSYTEARADYAYQLSKTVDSMKENMLGLFFRFNLSVN